MSESLQRDLSTILNNTIARAEAVLAENEKRKLHEPTVEFFRGQKVIAEQLLHKLEGKENEEEVIKATIERGKIKLHNEDGSVAQVIFDDGTFRLE